MKDTGALEEQREPGWKLFGKVPHKELSTKDSRKIQKVCSHTYTHTRSYKRPKYSVPDFECFFHVVELRQNCENIVSVLCMMYCAIHLNVWAT